MWQFAVQPNKPRKVIISWHLRGRWTCIFTVTTYYSTSYSTSSCTITYPEWRRCQVLVEDFFVHSLVTLGWFFPDHRDRVYSDKLKTDLAWQPLFMENTGPREVLLALRTSGGLHAYEHKRREWPVCVLLCLNANGLLWHQARIIFKVSFVLFWREEGHLISTGRSTVDRRPSAWSPYPSTHNI